MKTESRNLPVFNRDVIKYIAMFTMLLNHIAHVELFDLTPVWYEVLEDIGYFTAPVMCFFLVEGYQYTRSKKQYGRRLLLFAILSQIPYELAFHYGSANMIFTLFVCYLILVAMERIQSTIICTIICTLLVMVTVVSDWGIIAPLLTILLCMSAGNKKKMALSYGIICVAFVLINMGSKTVEPGNPAPEIILRSAASGIGILAAAFTVLVLYNGKRMERGKNFSKWFFYIFYPAHLLVLYLLKTFVLL